MSTLDPRKTLTYASVVEAAWHDCNIALSRMVAAVGAHLPRQTSKGLTMFAAALGVAAAMFWAVMLTAPPTSDASTALSAAPSNTVEQSDLCSVANVCP